MVALLGAACSKAPDPMADVTVGACDNSTGGLECSMTIVNHSGGTAD